jgi:hypothetical protein
VQLDTGNTFTKLNSDLVDQLYADLNATISQGYPLVDCSRMNMTGGLVVGFGSVNITVPFSDLIFTAGGLCAVGVISIATGGQQVLGDSFLRAAYGKTLEDKPVTRRHDSLNC